MIVAQHHNRLLQVSHYWFEQSPPGRAEPGAINLKPAFWAIPVKKQLNLAAIGIDRGWRQLRWLMLVECDQDVSDAAIGFHF